MILSLLSPILPSTKYLPVSLSIDNESRGHPSNLFDEALSINKETGKYFVDGTVGESKDNIIKGQYEKSIVDFLLKSLHVDSNVRVSGTLTVNQVDSMQMASDEDVLAASSQLMKRNKHVYKELSK